jgi:hypothetical protein
MESGWAGKGGWEGNGYKLKDECWHKLKPVVKKLVKATGAENYNVLQNNGRIAHQEVDHVCSLPSALVPHTFHSLMLIALFDLQVHFHMVGAAYIRRREKEEERLVGKRRENGANDVWK